MTRINGRVESLRTLPRTELGRRRERCRRCGARTSGGKGYCPMHLAAMPYVASLLRRLEPVRVVERGAA